MLRIWLLFILLMLLMHHFVDAFDANDVPVNGVLLNVGHDVFDVRKDPLDGALTQDLFDDPSFNGVVSQVAAIDTVLTQTNFHFHWFYCLVLSSSLEIYDDEFFNRIFVLELLKFKVDLERIYG